MAGIGMQYFAWAKMATEPMNAEPTYEKGLNLTMTVSGDLAITNAEGKLYADDIVAEEVSEFSSADLTMTGDHLELENQAKIYGAEFVDDELAFAGTDNAPYGGCGFVQTVMKNNIKKYRAFFFAKAKAKRPNETFSTKGESITFSTAPLSFTLMQPNYGKWERIKEFTTLAAARAWLDTELNVAAWHEVDIQVQGAGEGEGVQPASRQMVADGEALTLTVSGYTGVKAAYDNGVDVTSTITGGGGTYTLSAVTEAHSIVIVF